jgi:glycosyltransferase involved in cell wall biosynthesis
MEEKNIKVSVVITAYNVEKYIKKAINSVLNQTYKNIEIVVVEDCSTDNTLKFIKGLQKSDLAFPINLVQHKENVGAGLSRRDGIKASTGDFIMLLDADDWLNKDYIEHLVDRQKETDADIVGGGITYCYEDTDKLETNTFGTIVSEGFQKFADYNDGKVVFLNNKIVRSTMYDTVEYCDRRYVEDTPVIMKLLYNANKVAYVNEAGYNYLQRNGSLCHDSSRWKHNLFCALCCAELIEWFKDKPEPYKTIFGLGQFVEYLKAMNEIQVTKEEKQTYIEEYDQCMKYLVSHIS